MQTCKRCQREFDDGTRNIEYIICDDCGGED